MRISLCAALSAAAACGGAATTTTTTTTTTPESRPVDPIVVKPIEPIATPPVPIRLRVTIVSASVDGHKSDGSPWDDGSWSPPATQGPLATYLEQHGELAGTETTVGEPIDAPGLLLGARRSPAPDPMVLVEVGETVFRSPVAAGQFQPVWRFPFVVELVPTGDATLHLTIVDWDGPSQYDVMGDTMLAVKDLWQKRVVELPRFGNVERLLVSIEPAPPAGTGKAERVAVPGREIWTKTPIEVVAGQAITIRATGEVCSNGKDRNACAGPEGQAHVSPDNVAGFEQRNHAALIGAIGDVRFFVGRERRFVAASSGVLYLGVNDKDHENNSGEFEVAVELK